MPCFGQDFVVPISYSTLNDKRHNINSLLLEYYSKSSIHSSDYLVYDSTVSTVRFLCKFQCIM